MCLDQSICIKTLTKINMNVNLLINISTHLHFHIVQPVHRKETVYCIDQSSQDSTELKHTD